MFLQKKIFLSLTFLLAATQTAQFCGLFGDGTSPQQNIQLVVWMPFEDEENLRPILQAYQELHRNVQIIYVKKDIAAYEEELIGALAAGAGPDIFSIHNDWVPRYKDKLTPAPPKLFTAREFEETFVDVARQDLFDAEGHLYAVPLSVDVLALYYNRDLLGSAGIAAPPKTWEEVIAAVKKLKRQDKLGNFLVNGVALGTASNINRSTDILSLLMLQNGTQVYNSARTGATLDNEITAPDGSRYNPGAQALEFYTQFANPAKETYTWNNRNNYSIDAFVGGSAAMMLSYSYLTSIIRGKAPLLNFGTTPVPQVDLSKPKVNFANYFAHGVSKVSPAADWAWDFLKFAASQDNLQKFHALHKQPSSRKDLIATQIGDPDIGVFAEGALTAKTFYKPDAGRVEAVFARMIDDVILRGLTPPQAVSQGNQLLNDLLR